MKILSERQKKQVCKVCNRCDSPDMDTIITLCDKHLEAQAAMTERDEAIAIRDKIDREHGKCNDNPCVVCSILGVLDVRVIVAQARCRELGLKV